MKKKTTQLSSKQNCKGERNERHTIENNQMDDVAMSR